MQEEIIEDSGIVKKVEGNSVIVEIERGKGAVVTVVKCKVFVSKRMNRLNLK